MNHTEAATIDTTRLTYTVDEVAALLRVEIMTGALHPDAFVRLDETAARLGVSITPIREALRTLRGEGMVELEPHRGIRGASAHGSRALITTERCGPSPGVTC